MSIAQPPPSWPRLLPALLVGGMLGTGCGQESWCVRFNLACVLDEEPQRELVVDEDEDVWPGGPNGPDCDDTDPEIHPSAEEICDGIDNNCDGVIDEGTPGMQTWYLDDDEDNWGTDTTTYESCDRPPSFTTVFGDCDDQDWGVNPGRPEQCGNGKDDNCDGAADGCHLDGSYEPRDANSTLLGQGAGGRLGAALTAVPALDGNTGQDLLVGAPAFRVAGSAEAGAAWLLDRSSTQLRVDNTTQVASSVLLASLQVGSALGTAVDGAGDIDDDGYPDIVAGAPKGTVYDEGEGVVLLGLGPTPSVGSYAGADARIIGGEVGASLGRAVSGVPDHDGDGRAELLVGAPGADGGAGEVAMFLGPLVDTLEPGDAWFRADGAPDAAALGHAVDAGDLNGDGLGDIVVAGPDSDGGMVWVFFGPVAQGHVGVDRADATLLGPAVGDRAGAALSMAGDLDRDGRADLLIGGPGHDAGGDDAGAVWLVLGGDTLHRETGTMSLDAADARLDGFVADGHAGTAVAIGGDVDGDGWRDMLIGGPDAAVDGRDDRRGQAWLVLGGVIASRGLDAADATFEAQADGTELGAAVSFLSDVDGNGLAEVVIGVPGQDSGTVLIYRPEDF